MPGVREFVGLSIFSIVATSGVTLAFLDPIQCLHSNACLSRHSACESPATRRLRMISRLTEMARRLRWPEIVAILSAWRHRRKLVALDLFRRDDTNLRYSAMGSTAYFLPLSPLRSLSSSLLVNVLSMLDINNPDGFAAHGEHNTPITGPIR